MYKILYAARDSKSSKIQLSRFLNHIDTSIYKVRIAAYKKSIPQNINVDWTIDNLNSCDLSDKILENKFYRFFLNQIELFAPDLIISDFEYFTSYTAHILNIPIWQVSPTIIFRGINKRKFKTNIYNKYYNLLYKTGAARDNTTFMITNSNMNYVSSYLADIDSPPDLLDKYEWVRPYYTIGRPSNIKYNLVAASIDPNKNLIRLLSQNKKYNQQNKNYKSVLFLEKDDEEDFDNIILKNINNEEDYINYLYNSDLFVCDGSSHIMADAFYNRKFSIVLPNVLDPECAINSAYSQELGISKNIYDPETNLSDYTDISIIINYKKIDYIHNKINKFFNLE